MKINYKDADGNTLELEVSDDVGSFIITSYDDEAKNDRAETRRHTYFSEFEYEDARFFSSGTNTERSVTTKIAVRNALAQMTKRERFLIFAIHRDGRSYTELAAAEGKHPSTLMRETNKATAKFQQLYNGSEK